MKIAIIGLGNIGRVHAKVLSLSDVEIVALCDIDVRRAERIRDEFSPTARVYTDYTEMARAEKLDAVHVCTPHDLHARMVIYFLGCGVNVLCEKPLCINKEELAAIREAAERSDAMLGVCHQNRYNPSVLFAKEYLDGKSISGGSGSVVWHRDEKYYAESPWRASLSRAGGGALINQALHTLDLCQMLCGEPKRVTARAENIAHKGQIEVEDTLTAIFSDGGEFSFFATTASACSLPVEVTVRTDDGEMLTLLPHAVTVNGRTVFEEEPHEFHGKACYGNSHETLIEDFYDCIRSKRSFSIDVDEAAKVLRLIFAAYESNGESTDVR